MDDGERGDCGKEDRPRSDGRIGKEKVDLLTKVVKRDCGGEYPRLEGTTEEYQDVAAIDRNFRYDVRSQEVKRFEDG